MAEKKSNMQEDLLTDEETDDRSDERNEHVEYMRREFKLLCDALREHEEKYTEPLNLEIFSSGPPMSAEQLELLADALKEEEKPPSDAEDLEGKDSAKKGDTAPKGIYYGQFFCQILNSQNVFAIRTLCYCIVLMNISSCSYNNYNNYIITFKLPQISSVNITTHQTPTIDFHNTPNHSRYTKYYSSYRFEEVEVPENSMSSSVVEEKRLEENDLCSLFDAIDVDIGEMDQEDSSGLFESWDDIDIASICSSQGAGTPASITHQVAGENYLRLLREAQESNASSARVSLAGSRRDSPKSPPNSPVQGHTLKLEWQSYYINNENKEDSEFLNDWSSLPNQVPPKNWSFRQQKPDILSIRYARFGNNNIFSRKGLCTLFISNIVSLLLGTGIGLWLSRQGFFYRLR